MKMFLKKYKLEFIGLFVGAIAGITYWYFVGCASGTCMITSRPVNSAVYGGVMGVFLFGMFRKEETKTN